MSSFMKPGQKAKAYSEKLKTLREFTELKHEEYEYDVEDIPPVVEDKKAEDQKIEEPLESEPVDLSLLQLTDYLLKRPKELNRILRNTENQRRFIPKMLLIGLLGYTLFGVTFSMILVSLNLDMTFFPIAQWLDDPSSPWILLSEPESRFGLVYLLSTFLVPTIAISLGMIATNGICLPSFYFYGLLAGVRTSMVHVTSLALRAVATSAIATVGMLPVFAVLALSTHTLEMGLNYKDIIMRFGLSLPFIAGLFGVSVLYYSFLDLKDTMRDRNRVFFLHRLLVAWSVCFTAIAPVMIHMSWHQLDMWLSGLFA